MANEEGPIFYRPIHTYQLYSTIWTDSGLGLANPLAVPRIPFYLFISSLSYLNIPPVLIQQVIFFALILVPLISMPLLIKLFLPKQQFEAQIAAFFYTFNLYTESQVWYRFLFPQIFLWSYLPLFLLLFTLFLKSRKIRYLAALTLSSFIYSLMYSFVSASFVLWLPAAAICLYFIIIGRPNWLKTSLLGATTLIIWLLSNIWWIRPLLLVKDNYYSQLLDPNKNLNALQEVTRFFPNLSVLFLKQNYYFTLNPNWSFFLHQNYELLLITGIMLAGLIFSVRRSAGKLFASILAVGWFVSKGANPPFGNEFFGFLFSHFQLTQVLRNPYEKFGLVFLLPYSLFLSLGLAKITNHNKFFSIICLISICGFVVFPMWNGELLDGYANQVPNSYDQVNDILKKSDSLRLLSMPFLLTSSLTYSWGYRGEEQSELFFVRPALSRTYYNPGDPYPLLYQYIQNPNFSKLFPLFAINQVILHQDISSQAGYFESYQDSRNIINKWRDISPAYQSNTLSLFRYTQPVYWGYTANKIFPVTSTKAGLDLIINGQLNPTKEAFTEDSNFPSSIGQLLNNPHFAIQKLNAEHYLMSINNATTPFFIILSTSFNQSWQAKVDNQPISPHFRVNGYANAWYVKQPGSYSVELSFDTI